MICPKCKSKAKTVAGAINKEHDEVYRKRVCTECGYKFYTVEFPVEPNIQFKDEFESCSENKNEEVY